MSVACPGGGLNSSYLISAPSWLRSTFLIAAHRTATLLGCDRILVLESGRVVEEGAPDELLGEEGSRFAAMHERQRLQAEIQES